MLDGAKGKIEAALRSPMCCMSIIEVVRSKLVGRLKVAVSCSLRMFCPFLVNDLYDPSEIMLD